MSVTQVSLKDFNVSALRRMLEEAQRDLAKHAQKTEETENDKLVKLDRERGDSKPPPVTEDDLEDDDAEEYAASMKSKKGQTKNGKKAAK